MSGFYRSMEYIAIKMNSAKDTKQAIITAANTYEYVQRKVQEIGENSFKETMKVKPEEVEFNPKDVQSLVYRQDKEQNER